MQVYCPECHTGYELDERLLKNKSKKLKCSNCHFVFSIEETLKATEEETQEDAFKSLADTMSKDVDEAVSADRVLENPSESAPEDNTISEEIKSNEAAESGEESETKTEENKDAEENNESGETKETEENDQDGPIDLESIFERLSEHTEHLIEDEKKLPFYQKAWLQIKNVLGFHFKIRWLYIIAFCLLFVIMSLYNNRYDVVRKAPFFNHVYKFFGIKAKIPGEGLEFQNIGWDFMRDDEGSKLEIKGFISNDTDRNVEIPVIHIEILDKETGLLQSHNHELETNYLTANTKIPLDFVIDNPAPTAKYIYMTFVEKD